MLKLYKNLSITLFILLCFCNAAIATAPLFDNDNKNNLLDLQPLDETTEEKIDNLTNWITEQENKETKDKIVLSALYRTRGFYYEKENKTIKALSDYNTSLKYDANNLPTLKHIRRIKMLIYDYEGALIVANKIIKLEPKDYENYTFRGYIYLMLKKYKQAIDDGTKSILLKNKNPEAFKMRGLAKMSSNQKESGLQDIIYAKQQYYDLGLYEDYQKTLKMYNDLIKR
jgi:regulator of sirC expression with transglutaminase-like and TPR domain